MQISMNNFIFVDIHIALVDYCDQEVEEYNLNNQKIKEPCDPNKEDHESAVFGVYPCSDFGSINITESISESLNCIDQNFRKLLIISLPIVTFQNELDDCKCENPEH